MGKETVPGLLIKFVEPQYVDNFINNGELHFSPLGYFIDLENEYGDDVIGDKSEGSRIINFDPKQSKTTMTIDDKEYILDPNDVNSINVEFTDDAVREWGVLSLCNINAKEDFEIEKYDKKTEKAVLKIKDNVINDLIRLSDENKRIPVIINASGLLSVMDSKFTQKGRNIRLQNVEYYPESIQQNITVDEFKSDPGKIVFLKREKYNYQRESRIALFEDIGQNGENISIGSLKKCAFKLDPVTGLHNFRLNAIVKF